MIGTRHELGGLYNVRDIGGYPTIDGEKVARGLVFRASSLHRLDDPQAWAEFGAKSVIDLRYDREREAFPLPEFVVGVRHAPLLPENWKSSEQVRALPPAEHLSSVYLRMLDVGRDAIRTILADLAYGDSFPAVFFCMAGKDRTGVVAAILLSLLGVSDEDIADDFTISGDEVLAMVQDLRDREDFEDHPMMNQAEELLRAPRAAMVSFLAEVQRDFGSLSGYVRDLDVPEATIAALRARLLT